MSGADGSWDDLIRQWTDECAEFDEDFDEYALGTINVLESLIEEDPPASRAGVVSLVDDGRHRLIRQANRADIKGYDGKVLRIRHIVLSPRFDFGAVEVTEHALVLTSLLAHVLKLSDADMKAPHIKFHLRSPAYCDAGIMAVCPQTGKWRAESLVTHSGFTRRRERHVPHR